MKKLILGILVLSLVNNILADDDYERGYSNIKLSKYSKLYKEECASCHIGYKPRFLPAKNWTKLMSNLENHFGVDATFDKMDEKKILEYLKSNSNRRTYYNENIIQITKLRWFKKEHRKIPTKAIKQKEVKMLSNCMACHTKANNGSFRERDIKIPNFGWWDD